MQAEALVPQPAYGSHTTTAKPQRNNTHRTRAIQPMKQLKNKSQVPEDGCVPQPAYGYHTTTAKPQRNNTH